MDAVVIDADCYKRYSGVSSKGGAFAAPSSSTFETYFGASDITFHPTL